MHRYQEGKTIGEGTYGVVKKAFDKSRGVYVALKKMRLDSEEEGIPGTAIREISLLKQLNHENILELFDVIHHNKQLILVFELLDMDLKKYMEATVGKGKGGLPIQTVRSFTKQLVNGIAHCHKEKVIHRDLKPQNLLINSDLTLKIADFGLARAYGIPVRSYTNEVVTLWYRAPDILLGEKKYSIPVDMWSVGCIFAEMFTGEALFRGQNEHTQLEVIFKKLGPPNSRTFPNYNTLSEWKDEYANIRKKSPTVEESTAGLPKEGMDLLLKLLRYDPKRRYSARRSLKHPFLADASKRVQRAPQKLPVGPGYSNSFGGQGL